MNEQRTTRALLSVFDKTGVVEFAQGLAAAGVALLSTGGTCRLLREVGLAVTEVADYTGFPEMMDGRVKTLHPKIHGGILARRSEDDAVMAQHGIAPIDLVVVNLYPFIRTVARADCTVAEAIENIDIGGPAMIRSAAKNQAHVAVVVDPADYAAVLAELSAGCGVSTATRARLAAKAFAYTAEYDGAIAGYLSAANGIETDRLPVQLQLHFTQAQTLRYGENPHQAAALYREAQPPAGSLAVAEVLQGKALSYNNLLDADAALTCVRGFSAPACVIVKHTNPCGVAQADDALTAYQRAFAADAESAFGGIIAFNRPLDGPTAAAIVANQFVEMVIAPVVTDDARAALARKSAVRVLCTGAATGAAGWDLRRIGGGLLVQQADSAMVEAAALKIVSHRQPTAEQLDDLLFAWRVAKVAKSNAIVFAKDLQTVAIGCGQTSRVFAAKCAVLRANEAGRDLRGSVVASDAFFPFRDGLDWVAEQGACAVIQPGGSIRDAEVIKAADEHGIAMVFTGIRHFRH